MNLRNRQIQRLAPPRNQSTQPSRHQPPEPPQPPYSTHQTQANNISSKDVSLNDALDKLYTDISSVPSFSAKIEKYLRSNAVHSKHRRIIKKKFPRRKIISRFPFDLFMADLIEYPQLRFQNSNYKFILIIIDCFTRKIWAVPMKQKTGQ